MVTWCRRFILSDVNNQSIVSGSVVRDPDGVVARSREGEIERVGQHSKHVTCVVVDERSEGVLRSSKAHENFGLKVVRRCRPPPPPAHAWTDIQVD